MLIKAIECTLCMFTKELPSNVYNARNISFCKNFSCTFFQQKLVFLISDEYICYLVYVTCNFDYKVY